MGSPKRWLEFGLICHLRLNKEEGFGAFGQARHYEKGDQESCAKPGLFSEVCYAELNQCVKVLLFLLQERGTS